MQIIAIGVHKILFSVGDDAVCSTISNGSSRIYPETLLVVWTCCGISVINIPYKIK